MRGTKTVCGMRQLAYEDRRSLLKLYPQELRRERFELLLTRRTLLGQYVDEFLQYFRLVGESRTRGHDFELQKPRRLKLSNASTLSTRVVNTCNSLTEGLLSLPSEQLFKSALDQHLLRRMNLIPGVI